MTLKIVKLLTYWLTSPMSCRWGRGINKDPPSRSVLNCMLHLRFCHHGATRWFQSTTCLEMGLGRTPVEARVKLTEYHHTMVNVRYCEWVPDAPTTVCFRHHFGLVVSRNDNAFKISLIMVCNVLVTPLMLWVCLLIRRCPPTIRIRQIVSLVGSCYQY